MNINKTLKTITLKNIRYPGTNMTYEEILKKELHRFNNILQKHIDDYYDSYNPVVYVRGGKLRKSLTVDDVVEMTMNNRRLICRILINENAIHNSIMGGSPGNAFWLINSGWQVKKDAWFSDIYRLGYYEGYHFLEDAIEEFESTSKYGVTVEVVRPD